MSSTENNPTVSDESKKQDDKDKATNDDPMNADTQDADTIDEKEDSKSENKKSDKSDKSKGKDPKKDDEDEKEEESEDDDGSKRKKSPKRRKKSQATKKKELADIAEAISYDINEIVWAKLKGKQLWPARIVDDANAPKRIASKREASKLKSPTIVHFLDNNSYYILGKKDLKKWDDPAAIKSLKEKKPAHWDEAHKLCVQFKNGEYTPPPPKEEEDPPKKLLGKRKRTEFVPVTLGKNILEEIITFLEDKDTEDAQLVIILDILSKLSPTLNELSETQLGKKLRPLTKADNRDINSRARELVAKYKKFIKEEVDRFHQEEVLPQGKK